MRVLTESFPTFYARHLKTSIARVASGLMMLSIVTHALVSEPKSAVLSADFPEALVYLLLHILSAACSDDFMVTGDNLALQALSPVEARILSEFVSFFYLLAMKVRKLCSYLNHIVEAGYGSYVLYFSDQDEDYYTVSDVFVDYDGDICLQSSDDWEMSANDLLDRLSDVDGNPYVYFEQLYWDDSNLICDIEGGWYIDDDGDLTMDVTYDGDDDY